MLRVSVSLGSVIFNYIVAPPRKTRLSHTHSHILRYFPTTTTTTTKVWHDSKKNKLLWILLPSKVFTVVAVKVGLVFFGSMKFPHKFPCSSTFWLMVVAAGGAMSSSWGSWRHRVNLESGCPTINHHPSSSSLPSSGGGVVFFWELIFIRSGRTWAVTQIRAIDVIWVNFWESFEDSFMNGVIWWSLFGDCRRLYGKGKLKLSLNCWFF